MYTKDGAWATSATPLPMWGVDGSGMVPRPSMVSVSRDTMPGLHTTVLGGMRWCVMVAPNGSARCGSRVRLAVPERSLPW